MSKPSIYQKANIYLHFPCIFLALETAYNDCGWKVWILRGTAVSDSDGTSNFFSDNDFGNLEWGGTIIGMLKRQKQFLQYKKVQYSTVMDKMI